MDPVVVVTANYGGHDDPPRVPALQTVDVEWRYYTDAGGVTAPVPWWTYVESPPHAHPNLAAKAYKTMPPATGDCIWIDANMEITSPRFVEQALAARRDGIAAFCHPRRDCVYTEAEASLGVESQGGKYEEWRDAIGAQMRAYLDEGYPRHRGLFACGVVAYDLADERVQRFGAMWMNECLRWSPQDQLSFPVVAWRLGITPGVFPIPQIERRLGTRAYLANDWLRIWRHRPVSVP